jgi:hypothetical protein
MWVQGDETYLAVRTAIGVSKVSLHSTGNWALRAGAGRVAINGPRRLNTEWAVGPRIVYAGIRPRPALDRIEKRTTKPVLLFDAPPDAYWRDFAVLFGQPAADLDALIELIPAGSDLIGPLPHRSGGSAWLATFIVQMTEEQQAYIRTERSKFQVTIGGDPDALQSAIAILIQDTGNRDTMLVNIELGRENLVVGGL